MPRKYYSPEEKLKIVLETLKEERLITKIASEYGLHSSVIHRWRRELLGSAERIFASTKSEKAIAKEKQRKKEEIENLYSQVGHLTTQLEWLKKNLQESCHTSKRKGMVDWDIKNPHLTIKAQAWLLGVSRTGLYNPAKQPTELEIKIKHLLDKIHTDKPFKGSRRIGCDFAN